MNFGNLGFTELLMILVIVLVLFGARKVPEIGASIGKGIREFKKNIADVNRDVREPLSEPRAAERIAAGESHSESASEQARPEPKRLI
jgi:sec-independent protein translocase protein TatA